MRTQRRRGVRRLAVGLVHAWTEDNVADSAAALTFYAVLSLFPFLLCVVALGGLILGARELEQVLEQVGRVAPPQVLELLRHRMIATGAVRSLTRALDRAYDVHETRRFWRRWLMAIAVTATAGAAVLLDVALLFALPTGRSAIVRIARYPIAGAAMMMLWALLYWALPNVRPRFQRVVPGAVAGVGVWLAASYGLAAWLRHSPTWGASYGALGGMIALLFWTWSSLVILLMGAQLNRLLTSRPLGDTATGERASGRGPQPVPA